MELFSSILQFEDSRGDIVTVRMPPVLVAEEIRARYDEILQDLAKPHMADQSFMASYVENKKFRRKINNILSMVYVDASKLSIDVIAQLLFPHKGYDDQGEERFVPQGALLQFIFGDVTIGKPKSVSMDEVYDIEQFMGDLWACTEDWFEAMELMKTLSYKDLNKVLNARSWAMRTPEQKMKHNQQKASKKLMENLKAGKISTEVKKEVSDEPLSEAEMAKFFA